MFCKIVGVTMLVTTDPKRLVPQIQSSCFRCRPQHRRQPAILWSRASCDRCFICGKTGRGGGFEGKTYQARDRCRIQIAANEKSARPRVLTLWEHDTRPVALHNTPLAKVSRCCVDFEITTGRGVQNAEYTRINRLEKSK